MITFIKILSDAFHVLSSKEKKNWVLLLLSGALISLTDVASMVILVMVIGLYTQLPVASAIPFANFPLVGIFGGNSPGLLLLFLVFILIKNGFGTWVSRLQFHFNHRVAARISRDKLREFLDNTYQHYVATDSSASIRTISYQPIEFCQYVLGGLQQVINEMLLIAITTIVLVLYQSTLIALLFVLMLPPVLILTIYIRKKLSGVRSNIKTTNELALQFLHESVTGYVDVTVAEKKDYFINRFMKKQNELNQYLSSLQSFQNSSLRLMEVLAVACLLVLFMISRYTMEPGSTLLLNIGMFLAAAYKIIPGVVKIMNHSGQVRTYSYTIHDLTSKSDVLEKETETVPAAIASLFFKNVSYSSPDKSVLKNFTAEINSGDFVALTGPSGKGKTTVINLLLGFLEPQEGQIGFNAKAMAAKKRKAYWKNIAYQKQQTFVINDTLLTNITLDDGPVDADRLHNSLSISGLDHFIEKAAEGIDYRITENGKNISGGQKQRIAIARTIYKKASIYILDEPFSELDAASEQIMLAHFRELAHMGAIVILISHHERSQMYCNKIISLE